MPELAPVRILALQPGKEIGMRRRILTTEDMLLMEKQLPHEDSSLDDIDEALIDTVGGLLPEEISQAFRPLRWQVLADKDGLSAFYFGAHASHRGDIHLEDALGFVEYEQMIL